jgi:hypothetical protein
MAEPGSLVLPIQALAGDSLMSNLVTGAFERRIEAPARCVGQLESRS